ncbi:uncharacterized protein LOC116204556 [Punica granatum]|uniref:Uncharacterized protein LOC116204556 n=1 Tax=Punica granatum TaxID=22663 RepID=A0A6P8D7I8_PUNGR|nr:uncharacterized protein LOC116204556 [Punica granatum]
MPNIGADAKNEMPRAEQITITMNERANAITHDPMLIQLPNPPHSEWVDDERFPPRYKTPYFSRFSRDDKVMAIEHLARFTCQCKEASNNGALKLRIFPMSLTGATFTWHLYLPERSIHTLEDMKIKFALRFSRYDLGVTVGYLAQNRQKKGETVENYIKRFKKAKIKCRAMLSEIDYADMAYQDYDVDMAEFVKGDSIVCEALTHRNVKAKNSIKDKVERKYSFDVTKTDHIFDWLKCDIFRNLIQDKNESKELKFPKKKFDMAIDKDLFPNGYGYEAIYVNPSPFMYDTCVANTYANYDVWEDELISNDDFSEFVAMNFPLEEDTTQKLVEEAQNMFLPPDFGKNYFQ